MISNITITGVHFTPDDTTKKYVQKKIGRLDRFLPRHARKSASADVKLSQVDQSHGNKYEAEIIINIPEKTITAKDSTLNIWLQSTSLSTSLSRNCSATNKKSCRMWVSVVY